MEQFDEDLGTSLSQEAMLRITAAAGRHVQRDFDAEAFGAPTDRLVVGSREFDQLLAMALDRRHAPTVEKLLHRAGPCLPEHLAEVLEVAEETVTVARAALAKVRERKDTAKKQRRYH